ncbi:MAG: hypothetical protein M1827_002746 [Pycnora praestabilis]|nr:MAG: hypothetical protein M1827_002746 [Pycnora praestabilis]
MCLAELDVSTQPCRHRWYQLVRGCQENNDFTKCKGKLSIQGWEKRCDFCPFCEGTPIDERQIRLIGNDRSPSTAGLGWTPPISRRQSLASAGQDSRTGILARSDSNTSLTASQAQRNREQNAKIEAILTNGLTGLKEHSEPRVVGQDESLPPTPLTARSSTSSERPTKTSDKIMNLADRSWTKFKGGLKD